MAVSVRSRRIIGSLIVQISPIRAVTSRWSLMRTSITSPLVSLLVMAPPSVGLEALGYPGEGGLLFGTAGSLQPRRDHWPLPARRDRAGRMMGSRWKVLGGTVADETAATARAVLYTRNGGPEVLELVDRPVREPGPGEIRVRVHRAGVNPTEWKLREGDGRGGPVDPPQVPGQDGAGVVDAVGTGVEAALHGLRVWIWEAAYQRPDGTAQEFAVVPARRAVTLPDSASYDMGAALGVPFITAHRCLTVTEEGPRRLGPGTLDGRTVLVAGGAGAVGNAAIQLARWSDATVITTVSSPEKAQLAAAAGADHVIDYRREDVVREVHKIVPDGVDTIVEVAPAANAAIDVAVLA